MSDNLYYTIMFTNARRSKDSVDGVWETGLYLFQAEDEVKKLKKLYPEYRFWIQAD